MIRKIKELIPNILKRNFKGFSRNIIDSLEYYTGSGISFFRSSPMLNMKISKIIFVCKGNVCRSAFAEHRLKFLLDQNKVHIDSCGIDADQGQFPPQDSVSVAAEFSCSVAERRAKKLDECDIEGADLILPMEYWQYKRLLQLYPGKKENIVLLRSFAPFPSCFFCNIADPYGWGEKEFRRVYRLVDQALGRLIRWC
jgi:protein-tyrosine phosphatase